MHKVYVKRKIISPCAKVRSVLWEIESWANFWLPTHSVAVLYDDAFHQDFSMFLDWQAANAYIRTVRFLDAKGNIAFFSPTPPPPMIVHHGVWQLTPEDNQSTDLVAIRWFKIPLIEKETFEEHRKRLQDFSNGFVIRLENLLKCLGELCENTTRSY